MPPPMPNPSKRMTANPAKPVARYRPGKAIQNEISSTEEDDDDDDEDTSHDITKSKAYVKQRPPKATSFPAGAKKRQAEFQKSRHQDDEDEEGFVTEEEDEPDDESGGVDLAVAEQRSAALSGTPNQLTGTFLPARDDGARPQDGSETSEHDSQENSETDEDESSSEDEPQRKFQRPTFVKKADREKTASTKTDGHNTKLLDGKITSSSSLFSDQTEQLRRKEMAELMIKEKLERDVAARAAGRKGWDDDDEVAGEDTIDDTDGKNPEQEYAAWKLRELTRLKRDREAIEMREKEIEESERRRTLTQQERDAEDRVYLDQQKEEREDGKGKAGFMQRYHHKGAFFQDDDTAEILRKRDLMGAKFVDEVQNRDSLPQYMQIRDMTKLGRKGRTRYKDLRGEDTGQWGRDYQDRQRKNPQASFDVDERFRPDHDVEGRKGPTGANASVVQARRQRSSDGVRGGPREQRNGDQSTDQVGFARDTNGRERVSSYRDDYHADQPIRRSPLPAQGRSSRPSRSTSAGRSSDRDRSRHGSTRRKRSPSLDWHSDKRSRVKTS